MKPRKGNQGIIDVIYVNYNTSLYLLDSVRSLLRHGESLGITGRIIVVDNNSCSEEAAGLEQLPPEVTLIRSHENIGFGAACNLAARKGSAEYLLFLNPDTLILPETLPGLIDVLDQYEGAALAGPRQYADSGRVFTVSPMRGVSLSGELADALYSRGWFPEASLSMLERRAVILDREEPVPVRAISGAALAVGRRAFESLGGWDESFFLYSEDTDLCVRARAMGYPVLYLPAEGVVHFIEQSTSTDRSAAEEAARAGRDAFIEKHYSRPLRGLTRQALRAAQKLPLRRRRWEEALPAKMDQVFIFPNGTPDPEAKAFEVARSPLFDNCLSAFPTEDAFRIPAPVLERIPAGTYFARTAEKSRNGHWKERAIYRFEKERDVKSADPRNENEEGRS